MQIFAKATVLSLVYGLACVWTAFGQGIEAQLPLAGPQAPEPIEGQGQLGWESRYFSEGRDYLDGDSLLVGSFELGWNHLSGGVWYGYSPDQRYGEL